MTAPAFVSPFPLFPFSLPVCSQMSTHTYAVSKHTFFSSRLSKDAKSPLHRLETWILKIGSVRASFRNQFCVTYTVWVFFLVQAFLSGFNRTTQRFIPPHPFRNIINAERICGTFNMNERNRPWYVRINEAPRNMKGLTWSYAADV